MMVVVMMMMVMMVRRRGKSSVPTRRVSSPLDYCLPRDNLGAWSWRSVRAIRRAVAFG